MNPKNPSDLLFEKYLLQQGHHEFVYEKEWTGITKKPDYSLGVEDVTAIFDVKEFEERELLRGFGYSDPYKPIRSKINDAAKQFKPFKNKFPCSLVLYSERPDIQLDDNIRVLGAMYGELSLRIPFDNNSGMSFSNDSEVAFHKKGKMFDFDSQNPQNTTISALISLFNLNMQNISSRLRKELNEEERQEIGIDSDAYDPNGSPCVIVWENVLAKIPFPQTLFKGPFDQRWGREDDRINRVFVGKGIQAIERSDSNQKTVV